ncbi:MAG: sensor histidine kinase [Spirochaetota bacterium]
MHRIHGLEKGELLEAIGAAQARFISRGEPAVVFNDLLAILLKVTRSEYGFIGEVFVSDERQPYLKTHAITNISWNDETRVFYEKNAPGGLEFTNLKSLFGAIITTKEPVIANNPANDPRRAGLPHGHPPLRHFLGLPFFFDGEMNGMLGVANRPGGYEREIVNDLQPLLQTCAALIEGYRNYRTRVIAEAKLNENLNKLKQKNQQLQNFAHIVSHNLRNHAGNIQMLLQLIDESDEAEKLNLLNHAKKASAALTDTVEVLSQTVKTQFENPQSTKRVSLTDLIEKTKITLAVEMAKHVNLNFQTDFTAWDSLECDPSSMESVFLNLVSNSLRYASPKRDLLISVTSHIDSDGKRTLVFGDNGQGIDLNKQGHKIFGLYKTFHGNRDARGVGLYLTRHQLEAAGASIEVDSVVNEFTRFKISF